MELRFKFDVRHSTFTGESGTPKYFIGVKGYAEDENGNYWSDEVDDYTYDANEVEEITANLKKDIITHLAEVINKEGGLN